MPSQFEPNSLQEYLLDAWQRWVLTLDALRERGNIHLAQAEKNVPNVLDFKVELIVDGRTLERPVNYGLVQIVPPEGVKTDPAKPPFVVVDPRAGHGPGIGGMKNESEIGVILAAGHPCYFIGFAPAPMPGQTIEDVFRAEIVFIEAVAARHPKADSKPVIIGNCQAGWQTMIAAAMKPEIAGPILLAGSPLSYWAGVRGKNPMRYSGGVLGGTWLTALASDAGNGIFDGANLVANFESLNLANTYWQKQYNVYSKIDTEAPRFLEFETWWGSPVLLNAEEIQWITDNLFVGNKLASGQLRTSDGLRIDLRNIKSPIIVFCSWGDNITPPQQALGWITDLYDTDREIVATGQTIVYTLHQSIGHLGIFVSGKVATKEYDKFANCMDMISLMPPGLYEAVITEVTPDTANPSLVHGKYLFQLEARTLDDIRRLGENSPEDDLRFATAARLSDINKGLYRQFWSPFVRAMFPEPVANAIREAHPNRARFSMFSDRNPAMAPVKQMANTIRQTRQPVGPDNPWLALEQTISSGIAFWLDAVGNARDAMVENMFLGTYGSPLLQALVGLGEGPRAAPNRIERDLAREAVAARVESDVEERFDKGEVGEALLRALIYIRRREGVVDERGFAATKAVRDAQPAGKRISSTHLKDAIRDQFLLLAKDEERAIQALPKLLPASLEERRGAWSALQGVLAATGEQSEEVRRRTERVEALFDLRQPAASKGVPVNA